MYCLLKDFEIIKKSPNSVNWFYTTGKFFWEFFINPFLYILFYPLIYSFVTLFIRFKYVCKFSNERYLDHTINWSWFIFKKYIYYYFKLRIARRCMIIRYEYTIRFMRYVLDLSINHIKKYILISERGRETTVAFIYLCYVIAFIMSEHYIKKNRVDGEKMP